MTRFLAITLAIVAVAAILTATGAWGQPACTKRADVVAHLSSKYAESPVAIGLANNGGVVELIRTGDGSTWTIIITMPNGKSCMVVAGEAWEAVPAAETPKPGDST